MFHLDLQTKLPVKFASQVVIRGRDMHLWDIGIPVIVSYQFVDWRDMAVDNLEHARLYEMVFGQLRKARQEAGLTQAQMAEAGLRRCEAYGRL